MKLLADENFPPSLIAILQKKRPFPQLTPGEIALFLNGAIDEIKRLKKKKKPFTAIYSEQGVTLIEEKDPKE